MKSNETESRAEHFQESLLRVVAFLKSLRRRYNRSMAAHYSAGRVAAVVTGGTALVAVVLLFVPNLIGVADDGSLQHILNAVGLRYLAEDAAQPVGAWFVPLYARTGITVEGGLSTHLLLLNAAMLLDNFFTPDSLFDVRFLAVLYLILYLPALWLMTKQLVLRTNYPSEGTVVGIVCFLFFSDVSYLSYFNSLYPEPVWLIGICACTGLCLSMQCADIKRDSIRLLLIGACGTALAMCERHCAVAGFALAIYCLAQTGFVKKGTLARVAAVLSATVLIMAGVVSLSLSSSRFTEDSTLNAMISGVLMESTDPAATLAEFDIDPRFETLADSSCHEDFPYALSGNETLIRDFYPHYSQGRLLLYYLRHPPALLDLLGLGVRAAFEVRRDYCGNYAMASGMAARARTIWFGTASNFKSRSAPKTIGYLVVLAAVYIILLNRSRVRHDTRLLTHRRYGAAIGTFATVLALGLLHMVTVIIFSGSAELSRYSLVLSVCIDIASLLTLAEGLHRLNLLETE